MIELMYIFIDVLLHSALLLFLVAKYEHLKMQVQIFVHIYTHTCIIVRVCVSWNANTDISCPRVTLSFVYEHHLYTVIHGQM